MATRIPFLLSVFALLSGTITAADDDAHRIGLVFEGVFEAAEVAQKRGAAEKTQLVATYEWDYGVRFFTKEKWEAEGFDWDRIDAAARQTADDVAATLTPEYIRDERDVIEYAIVKSEDPFLSSALLSPAFPELFADTLGNDLQVILVDRHRIYVFPATGGTLAEYGPAIVEEFRRTNLPISLEVFRVDASGYRVVGELTRPD